MRITFDPVKRDATLNARGLDIADAGLVFSGLTVDIPDERQEYGEPRVISVGASAGPHGDRGLDTA